MNREVAQVCSSFMWQWPYPNNMRVKT
jgi:hypothetical protein